MGSGINWNSFKHLCMSLLNAKMKALEWPQHIPHCKPMGIFPNAQGQLSLQSVVGSGRNSNSFKHLCMSLLYAKMKALEWPQHIPHCKPMGIFPNAQGQLSPQSVVGSGRNSNSIKSLWLSSLPARMKKIRSKMKALEWPQDFPHYNPMEAICRHGSQSSDNPIWPKT